MDLFIDPFMPVVLEQRSSLVLGLGYRNMRIVEEMLAARGILVSHETVRQWPLKFG